MKKYLIFVLLILSSCERDELFLGPELPQQTMIFEQPTSVVSNGQDIYFEILDSSKHELIILDQNGSVITKESFISQRGLNNRKLYTNSLPKQELKLVLSKNNEVIKSTNIIIK